MQTCWTKEPDFSWASAAVVPRVVDPAPDSNGMLALLHFMTTIRTLEPFCEDWSNTAGFYGVASKLPISSVRFVAKKAAPSECWMLHLDFLPTSVNICSSTCLTSEISHWVETQFSTASQFSVPAFSPNSAKESHFSNDFESVEFCRGCPTTCGWDVNMPASSNPPVPM